MTRVHLPSVACGAALGAALLGLAAAAEAEAAPVLDQSFLGPSQLSGGVGAGHVGAPTLTQTFTVGLSGALSAVALPLYSLNLPSTVTVGVRAVSGGVPVGDLLGSASLDAARLPRSLASQPITADELTPFDFASQGIAVAAGEQLAIVLSATEPSRGASGAGYYGGAGYAGGRLTLDVGGGPIAEDPYALFFRTYVDTAIAAAPEPASFALFGSGLASLLALRRRGRRC